MSQLIWGKITDESNILKLVLMPHLKIYESVVPLLFYLIRMAFLPWPANGVLCYRQCSDDQPVKHHRTGAGSAQIL